MVWHKLWLLALQLSLWRTQGSSFRSNLSHPTPQPSSSLDGNCLAYVTISTITTFSHWKDLWYQPKHISTEVKGSELILHMLLSSASWDKKFFVASQTIWKVRDGCRAKLCKWYLLEWFETKIGWMRNATQHNALQSEDWWRNVQENDAGGASDWMPYKGFSAGATECQLSLGAHCQLAAQRPRCS